MKNITQIYNPNSKNIEIEFNTKISVDDLSTVPNGYIENCYCDILDTLEFSKRIMIQDELMKKIMLGGSIQIKVLNTLLLSKKILKGDIDIEQLNHVVCDTVSVLDQQYLDKWIKSKDNYSVEKIDLDSIYTIIVMKRIK